MEAVCIPIAGKAHDPQLAGGDQPSDRIKLCRIKRLAIIILPCGIEAASCCLTADD
jgi:hypothetical protein